MPAVISSTDISSFHLWNIMRERVCVCMRMDECVCGREREGVHGYAWVCMGVYGCMQEILTEGKAQYS